MIVEDGAGEERGGRVGGGVATAASAQRATIQRSGATATIVLEGDWSLSQSIPSIESLLDQSAEGAAVEAVEFDAASLGSWDSSLLVFLQQVLQACEAHQVEFRNQGLPDDVAALLDLTQAVPEHPTVPPAAATSRVAALGIRGMEFGAATMAAVEFAGLVAQGVGRVLTFRTRMRWRDFWKVVQDNGAGALPIVTLIAFLVGLIIAFLGATVLQRFGAGYYVSYLVGYGMLREMAALMTGIIMAGRTGAGFAAELGSMKISEEVDAYETLGLSPIDQLVLPRVLGLFVMMPLLTIYAMFVGVLGGLVVATSLMSISVVQFIGGLLTPVTLGDALLGVFKGIVFGLIIGVVGCMRGLQTGSDAGAVGRAATSAVVTGITLIIVANAIIDWLSALLGV